MGKRGKTLTEYTKNMSLFFFFFFFLFLEKDGPRFLPEEQDHIFGKKKIGSYSPVQIFWKDRLFRKFPENIKFP